jgi:undecaprenyl-diphosphatase
MAIGGFLGLFLKIAVERARPLFDEPVAHAGGYSFPSGHALNSMLGVTVILLILLPVLHGITRVVAFGLGFAVVLMVGFDRVALGVHYVSDVLAGWSVAFAVVAATSVAFETWRRSRGRRPTTPLEGVEPEAAPQMSDSA